MRIFIFLLFIFITTISESQSLTRLIRLTQKEVDAGSLEKALQTALQADSICVADSEEINIYFPMVKRLVAYLYFELEEYTEAESYYKKAIELYREYSDPDDPGYSITLSEYSMLLMELERYSEAEPLLLEALDLQEGKEGNKSSEYAYALINLGSLYYDTGKYNEAESKLKEAISIPKIREGEFNHDYAFALDLLADIYMEREEYNLSLKLYSEALIQYKKNYGEKSSEYATSLSKLADLYSELSQFEAAEPMYLEALQIEKSLGNDRTEEYSYYLCQLANVYRETSEYEKAEKMYREALEIQESGEFDTSDTYFNLSGLYMLMADFASAEDMCKKSISKEELADKNSYGYVAYLNLLGNLYTMIGSFDKALKVYLELVEKSKLVYGEESTDYATNLDNLANLYKNIGEWELAEPITLKALEIKKKNLGEISTDVAYSIDNLASISLGLGKFSDAEKFTRQSIEILGKTVGEEHTDYGRSLNKLALLYMSKGKYSEAEPLLRKSVNLFRNKVGENHPYYAATITTLAGLFEMTGKQDSAEILYLKVLDNLYYQISRNFSFLAEKEKEEFIASISTDFSDFNSFVFRRKSINPAITCSAYNNQLAIKGIVLQSSKAFRNAVLNSGNEILIDKYNRFISKKTQLSQQEQLPISQRWMNTDSLENLSVSEEKELIMNMQAIPGFSNFSGFENTTRWEDVQKSLGEKEAAIEFISFDEINMADSSVMNIYCALLVKAGMRQPEMIRLFKEEDLEDLLKTNRSSNDAATADKIYSFQSGSEYQVNATGTKNHLYSLVWEPIAGSIEGIETIYYSPTGLLNLISFDAIPCSDSTYLSDRYNMVAVTSTREVIKKTDEIFHSSEKSKMIFYGGINYDSDTTRMKSETKRNISRGNIGRSHFVNIDSVRGNGFFYLEGTLREVQRIVAILNNKKINSLTLTGDEATEESFKSLDNLDSPACIHIATHGFFFPEPENHAKKDIGIYSSSDNPLFRSGLIFAGGNHAWKNQALPAGVEDGILLASEVSDMYLPNTQLVVLSACETGLGEIKGTEGVFGLQRVFKMAGVNFLIISLWQVPDYQTSELMNKFYENWISGKTIHDSFRGAQDFMKAKYHNNPSTWAAFTLVE